MLWQIKFSLSLTAELINKNDDFLHSHLLGLKFPVLRCRHNIFCTMLIKIFIKVLTHCAHQLRWPKWSPISVLTRPLVTAVTVSIERLETTIMYPVGGSRETNTTVLKLQICTL